MDYLKLSLSREGLQHSRPQAQSLGTPSHPQLPDVNPSRFAAGSLLSLEPFLDSAAPLST